MSKIIKGMILIKCLVFNSLYDKTIRLEEKTLWKYLPYACSRLCLHHTKQFSKKTFPVFVNITDTWSVTGGMLNLRTYCRLRKWDNKYLGGMLPSMPSLWHCFDKCVQCQLSKCCICFSTKYCIDDGRAWLPCNALFSKCHGLYSVVGSQYVKRMQHVPWKTPSKWVANESWHYMLGMEKSIDWNNIPVVIHDTHSLSTPKLTPKI